MAKRQRQELKTREVVLATDLPSAPIATNGSVLTSTDEREFHPASCIFPLIEDDAELQEIADDITEHGQREPILLHPDGSIIDGRNRYRACMLAGVPYRYEIWDGNGDLMSLSISLNLHRRHLSTSQRAMIAATLANTSHGGNNKQGANLHLATLTIDDAADAMKVSARSAKDARSVSNNGVDGLSNMVSAGDVSVSAAAKVAKLPKQDQVKAVEAGPEAVKDAAKQGANLQLAGSVETQEQGANLHIASEIGGAEFANMMIEFAYSLGINDKKSLAEWVSIAGQWLEEVGQR